VKKGNNRYRVSLISMITEFGLGEEKILDISLVNID